MNKTKKIVIINNIWSPYSNARYNEIQKQKNIELYVLFQMKKSKYRKWDKEQLNLNYNIRNLKGIHIPLKKQEAFYFNINYDTYSVLKKINPDRVIATGWDSISTLLALIYCKVNRKEFILWSGSTKYEKSFLRAITKQYVKWIVKRCDGFISYGTKASEYLRMLGAKKKIYPFYNSIDVKYFREKSKLNRNEIIKLKKEYNIPERNKIICFSGRLVKIKKVNVLIKSFNEINKKQNNATLLIIGEGPEKKKMEIIAKNNPNIIFTGNKKVTEIPKLYGMSDLFVLPSKQDIWGLVVNEAMASGCAIIATTKCGSSYDLIKGNGIIVEPENVKKLKEAIENIIFNEKKLNKMKKESVKIISEYTNEKIINTIPYLK